MVNNCGRRVVQVVQHLAPGGIETMVLDLRRFAAAGDQVLIVSLEGDQASACLEWPRLRDHCDALVFLNKGPGWDLGLIAKLARLFLRHRTDVVHTHHIGPLLYGGMAARLAGVPFVVHTEHDAWHLNDPRRRRLESWLLRAVRPTLVADADCVAECLRRALPHTAPVVIRNGIDTQRFVPGDRGAARQALGLPQQQPIIGCAARLVAEKGHSILLQALAQLDGTIGLALAGAGAQESLLRVQVARLGLQQRVHFLGRVDDMPRFYQAIDVFCLPSFAEGMPLSPLEAQACGRPAVVTDVGGAPEVVCPHSGKIVPAGDATTLAQALADALREAGRVSPRDFVAATADVRTMVGAYNALLKSA
jgi:glycosyltransferase involved in cell wall biosynthesis